MQKAMRISVSDMFYVEPVLYQNQYYAGGAIDLAPIELALEIADEVILEKKNNYTNIEESLVRAVLGFSGNERLEEIKQFDTNSSRMFLPMIKHPSSHTQPTS